MLEPIVEACHYLLNNFPTAEEAKKYINDRLTEHSQELFKFGYFPRADQMDVLFNMVDIDVVKKNRLCYSKTISDAWCQRDLIFSYFENYPLILPFKNAYGDVVALVGRTLLPEVEYKAQNISKYKNTIFTKGNHLFGLFENKNNILEKDCVIIVEGQLDVIKGLEHGIDNIVALGNSNMTAYQFSLITRYTENIFVLLDNDEAGLKGRKLIHKKFGKHAKVTDLYLSPQYKDIDEYLSKNKNIRSFNDICFEDRVSEEENI